ncbi:hypothetical protein N752_08995 [Desulforamulus aquiferis]|nr:hypothetical protein N752_08995 [Desulforamulus aquiferis]
MALFLVLPWTRLSLISYNIVKMGNIGNYFKGWEICIDLVLKPRKKHHLVQSVFYFAGKCCRIYLVTVSVV